MGKFAPEIHKFLKSQGEIITADIKRRLEKIKKDAVIDPTKIQADDIINNYHSSSWAKYLIPLLKDFFVSIYVDSMQDASAELGLSFGVDSQYHAYAELYAEQRTAELVTKLDDSTRDMLRNDLIDYMNQGLTPAEIADKLQENYAFSDIRSMTIARTETGFCWNHAGITNYKLGGAKYVRVYDGDYDKACQEADGQVWTFAYALKHLLQHPRCVRSYGPEMDADHADRGEGDELDLGGNL